MRSYPTEGVCGFRFSRADWGEFSNFFPLPRPIESGPWSFATSEHLYHAAKFAGHTEVQRSIAAAPTAREAAALGRRKDLPADPRWTEQRVNVMRWVIRLKLETVPELIAPLLARTGDRAIVEISPRDRYWGAALQPNPPHGSSYRGSNVLGRLWMELRQHHREADPLTRSATWLASIRIGALAGDYP